MGKYRVYVRPQAWKETTTLPGHMRQRIKRAISELENDPRPSRTKALVTDRTPLEVRRLRLDDWRVLYTVNEELNQVRY